MKTIVPQGHVGLLFKDGVLERQLQPGRHDFAQWAWSAELEVVTLDVRERSATIKNQEILTADKVSVRLSLLVYYRIVDAVAAVTKVEKFEDRIYEDVQLAARRFLATRSLDEILKDRNELSESIKADVKASAASYGVEILRADVKDLVFPGNLREIMNKVIETERQSEARLIEARAKAEASRLESRAQIAALEERLAADEKLTSLLKQNPELVRLKELEVLKEIGMKGGNHFYFGLPRLGPKT
jgi:regulator of protease activity HflC (stomatin/prohibitin superfamily)